MRLRHPTRRQARAFDADYAWANALWHHCEALAAGLPGPVVVDTLAKASAALYAAGYDDAFKGMTRAKGAFSASAVAGHDVGWLSVWATELAKAHKLRRRRV